MKPKIKYHYTESYLLNPLHPVTVTLVGCGGTGSQFLNNLARIHAALVALGHPGLHVTAWDNDEITTANLGRQLFSSSELGMNKAVALITRINRFYGLQWDAEPKLFEPHIDTSFGNIIITAADNVSIRKLIGSIIHERTIKNNNRFYYQPENRNYYWMDLGNSKTSGQVILGTSGKIVQPKKVRYSVSELDTITELFPNLESFEKDDDTPSCSLAEALTKQDLFINSILAQYGANLLWKMFRELKLEFHGLFLNLQTLQTNPIKL
jgi:PRTRC genetic system ThiF family protein